MRVSTVITLVILGALPSCGGSSSGSGVSASVFEISFTGIGAKGIFDPSLILDPGTGRIWMTYSEVEDSVMWPGQNKWIHTRLACSDDNGYNWADSGSAINVAQDLTLPLSPPNDAGTWTHEVSSLVYDTGASSSERWKLLWHRYLLVNGSRAFQHSWIAMKTAAAPTGPWSSERKLFVGSLYDTANNVTIGAPEVQLDLLDAELNASLAFTEPGMVSTASALYVTLLAAEGLSTNGRIILLKYPHPSGPWEFKGSLLVNGTDGPSFGYDGFSAPDLYEKGGIHYLIATPQTGDSYQGTMIFKIDDLETALLNRSSGVPVLTLQHSGTAGSHNGAASYIPDASTSGFLYSEVLTTLPQTFRIFASRSNP